MKYNIITDSYYNSNKLLLTPNQRLARKLTEYCYSHKQKTQSVSLNYNIKSFNDFIVEIIHLIFESGFNEKPLFLIDSWQREIIFKKIINENNDTDLAVDAIYKKVEQAWIIANDWHLDWHTWQDYPQLESKLFTQWLMAYQQYLVSNNYLDPNNLIEYLIKRCSHANIVKIFNSLSVTNLDLYGFDDLTPAQKSFFKLMSEISVLVNNIDDTHSELNKSRCHKFEIYTAENIEQEYYAVASWARSCLEEGQSNIGIVVPNLANHRKKLIQVFERILPNRQSWNISGGDLLNEVPLVKAGLILLNLAINEEISRDDVKYLLKSKYYYRDSESEQAYIGSVDLILAELEFNGYVSISLDLFVEKFTVVNQYFCEQLLFVANELSNDKLKLPSQWAIVLSRMLYNLGWPAGVVSDNNNENISYNINSLEFQAIQQFNFKLQQVFRLDKILGSINSKKLYYELNNLIRNTTFQIQTDNTKIDILGMLEGAGIYFDKLWLFNFTSDVWPQTPQPNPFIPIEIQKNFNLPQTTAEREYLYAKKLTTRYLASSDDIMVSYSKFSDDQENKLSLLFNLNDNLNTTDFIQKFLQKLPDYNYQMISLIDNRAPKLDKSYIKSGVKALSLQADCPFRAFAEIRLNAKSKYKLDVGPAAWLRGQMIHRVLELVFKKYNSKNKLQELCVLYKVYEEYLYDVINKVINEYKLIYKNTFSKGIVLIEQELIFTIVNNWIQLELTRDGFEVLALEQEFLVKINNIEFKVRVDRIDRIYKESERIADKTINNYDHLAIIDYKTSQQNINSLFKDEISDLQLPIYLAIDKLKNVDAVVYAEVLEENFGFKGISSFKSNLEGCIHTEDWSLLVDNWHKNLNSLAQSFSSGEAYITGKQFPQVCTNCHLSSLCRKDEVEYA